MDGTNPILCTVDKEYLKYLKKIDYRVNVKQNRPFAGIITMVDEQKYIIPLTSQTTEKRREEGKNKRSALITTFVTESSSTEIANLLYNNMIPIIDGVYHKIEIDSKVDTYLSNEIRFIRKEWDTIKEKANTVYTERYKQQSANYHFLNRACCDYKKLEQAACIYTAPDC